MAISRILGCAAVPCAGGRGARVAASPAPANPSKAEVDPNVNCEESEEESVEMHEGAAPRRPVAWLAPRLPASMSGAAPVDEANHEPEHCAPNPKLTYDDSIVVAPNPKCEFTEALSEPKEGTVVPSTPRRTKRTARSSSIGSLAKVADKAKTVLSAATMRGACRRAASPGGSAEPEIEADVQAILRLLEPGQPLAGLSDFAKEYGDAAFCRRLLRKFEGDVRKASRKFEEALRWREQNKELITTRRFAPAGDNRVLGLDNEGRPILYTCLRNQMLPGAQGMDLMTVRTLEAVDLMAPGVEKATHVWDLHGMMVRLNLSPAPLVQMVQSMEGYFAERVHKVVIIDMPGMSRFLKDAVWPLVSAKTKDKIVFLTAQEAAGYFRAQCPQEMADRLGTVMAQNRDPRSTIEDRKKTWMRLDRSGQMVPALA